MIILGSLWGGSFIYGFSKTEPVIIFPESYDNLKYMVKSDAKKYIFADPEKKNMIINPQDHQLEAEIRPFKSHSNHYIGFWALFFLMRVVRW